MIPRSDSFGGSCAPLLSCWLSPGFWRSPRSRIWRRSSPARRSALSCEAAASHILLDGGQPPKARRAAARLDETLLPRRRRAFLPRPGRSRQARQKRSMFRIRSTALTTFGAGGDDLAHVSQRPLADVRRPQFLLRPGRRFWRIPWLFTSTIGVSVVVITRKRPFGNVKSASNGR